MALLNDLCKISLASVIHLYRAPKLLIYAFLIVTFVVNRALGPAEYNFIAGKRHLLATSAL